MAKPNRERLRDWREKAAALTQEKAAHLAGTRQSTWSAIENGRRQPSLTLAIRIAELTGGEVPVEGWREAKGGEAA